MDRCVVCCKWCGLGRVWRAKLLVVLYNTSMWSVKAQAVVDQIVWFVGARRSPYPNERLRMSAAISVSLLESESLTS